ncbi:uncharacterized protein V1516DRAFT_605783, partial [Lipomyces oligophaga]|uniref:uncharacterized protein n=1 Tax=Lipomyces oligophaga TaxID=45792 RepID=UPI0034CE9544
KGRKRKRPLPPGISDHDAEVLKRVRKNAYYLDMSLGCCCCCGWQIGWGGIIGFIPGFGDLIASFLAYNVVRIAGQIDGGLPPMVHSQMLANVLLDFTLGLVPIVGDIVNIFYKASSRNALLLDNLLRER